jgi:hypothetical protein
MLLVVPARKFRAIDPIGQDHSIFLWIEASSPLDGTNKAGMFMELLAAHRGNNASESPTYQPLPAVISLKTPTLNQTVRRPPNFITTCVSGGMCRSALLTGISVS